MRWLLHLQDDVVVIRVNHDQPERIEDLRISDESVDFMLDDFEVHLSELTTVWYRKGRHWLCNLFLPIEVPDTPHLKQYLEAKLKSEEVRLSEYVHTMIEQRARCVGSSERGDLNKLLVLRAAVACGFKIPRFLVSNSAASLAREIATASVTKAISDGLYLFDHSISSRGYFSYTERVVESEVQHLPPRISPSMIQTEIRKKFDIRVFYLDGRCFSMAIFSQSDERTQVDFRRYNDENPNRTVPYRLPANVEGQLRRLFADLRLNTGSVDLVLDESGDYVFLEINPVGQFGMVSAPCNYYLERELARTLIRYERNG